MRGDTVLSTVLAAGSACDERWKSCHQQAQEGGSPPAGQFPDNDVSLKMRGQKAAHAFVETRVRVD